MKLIKFLLKSVSVMFILLFSLFFLYIYKDNKNTNNGPIFIETIEFEEETEEPLNTKLEEEQNEEILLKTTEVNTIATIQNKEPEKTKFYYTNLDEYSKLIYNALEDQKDKLKNGTAEITISNKLSEAIENGENIESIFSAAVNAFEHDNPDIFYLEMSKLILYYEKNYLGKYKIYLKAKEENENYLISSFKNEEDIDTAQRKIDLVVNSILKEVEVIDNDYDKILYIHDWLAENIKYDETMARTNKDTIYGALVEGEAVCGGYAKAFKYLMDKLNINTIIVQGIGINEQGQENHAWNYVQLDGKWYGIDCTWDDPIIIGDLTFYTKKNYYTYFLKGQNAFYNDHKPFETFYGTNLKINYPELNTENY